MLNEIKIDNFRNLKDVTIQPKLLTLLIGPNGTGKSGIFHSLCVLKQSFEMDKFSDKLTIGGNQVNLGSRKEIVWRHDEANDITISIKGDFTVEEDIPVGMSSNKGSYDYKLTNSLRGNKKHVQVGIGGINLDIGNTAASGDEISFNFNNNSEKYKIERTEGLAIQGSFQSSELRTFDPYFGTGAIESVLENIYYVPVQRGISQFKTLISPKKPPQIVTSQGTAKLTQDILETVYYDYDLLDRVSKYTNELLHKEIRPALVPTGLGDFEETIDIKGTAEFFDDDVRAYASNTGFGLNQVFFMLVQVLDCPSGSTILIEEPETSLHPVAQNKLVEILIKIAKDEDKQIIMTSHSEHIAFGLFGAVEKSYLDARELSMYSFEEANSNESKVKELKTLTDSLKKFLGDDPLLTLRYVDAFGKKDQMLEHGTVGD